MKRLAHRTRHGIPFRRWVAASARPSSTSRRLVCSLLAITVIVGLSVSLVGCASIGPATPVAVADVKSLSGTWEGIVYLPGSERDEVTLTIRADGSYHVASKTGLGVTTGTGHIVVSDGHLVIQGRRGRGTATVLRSAAGDLLMKVDMILSDNSNLSAELWRTR